MVAKILDIRSIQISLSIIIVLGMIFCIFTPNYYLFKMGARFAGQIMLFYMALGITFLILNQPRLMFTSLACCAGLCIFLKQSSNSDLKHPVPTDELSIKVAHFNVSVSDEDYESTVQAMLQADADLISIQELTPDWQYALNEVLTDKYPYYSSVVRFDPFGLAVYSKHPIEQLDTFYFEEIPNYSGTIKINNSNHKFKFVCGHTTPPLYSLAYEKMKGHIKVLAQEATQDSMPVITIGNFHAPPWWAEIQDLRTTAQLADSRRSAAYGISEIFQSPGDYIFYNQGFSCLNFENIFTPNSSHLGIQGRYQFKRNAEKAN